MSGALANEAVTQERIETGACFCGKVAAELSGTPLRICFDHDDDCRKAVGAPLNVWVGYRAHQIRFTRGAPRSFSKTAGMVVRLGTPYLSIGADFTL